jgi:methylisocitrate lyase|tara:strand:+ start:678 stop:1838 length:1161 start_codon:yes stop_codon:yes gene_type:complete
MEVIHRNTHSGFIASFGKNAKYIQISGPTISCIKNVIIDSPINIKLHFGPLVERSSLPRILYIITMNKFKVLKNNLIIKIVQNKNDYINFIYMDKSTLLRKTLKQEKTVLVPGIYDALSAKIAERVGFNILFHTGYGTAATLLGVPDIGLVSFFEMKERVSNICNAVDVPVIADADTGYGNSLNTMRTVKDYIRSGAAGLILEDQVWPKKCGHMQNKDVISIEEMEGKIKAAVKSRTIEHSDLVIVGRTDSLAVEGLDNAIARVKTYQKAGADILFIEAPNQIDDLKEINSKIEMPLLLNQIEGGQTPIISLEDAQRLGFKIILFPLTSLYASTKAIFDTFTSLMNKKTSTGSENKLITFDLFNELVNHDEFIKLEKNFSANNINK